MGTWTLAWVCKSLFPLEGKEVMYWPQTEVLAVPGLGNQLFNLLRCLVEVCGNLAVHKEGNILPPILEFIHCCCYEGFRSQSESFSRKSTNSEG